MSGHPRQASARTLFLELSALGFEMQAERAPEDPTGFVVGIRGSAYGDELLERVRANKAGLCEVLTDEGEDPEAIRKEGMT